ncbi:MAG: hypothetical protein WA418_14260 [Bradyrhizobium sp.]
MHDFRKSEIEIFLRAGLDRTDQPDAAQEFGFSAQVDFSASAITRGGARQDSAQIEALICPPGSARSATSSALTSVVPA